VDILGSKDEIVMFALPRIPRRKAVHGTGCALSAGIAALLAQKAPLDDAIQLAKEFVTSAIEGAQPMGRGGARMLDFQAPLPEPSGLEYVEEPAEGF
jgi:hydroxymethylpyrimidine/phosphomethylpyrimidine kinase